MLSQNKLNVSQNAFLFSIIMHVFIVIVLLNFAVEKNDHITSNIKITLISASSVNHKDAMFLSSKDSQTTATIDQPQPQPQPQPISETIFNSAVPANTSTENQVPDFFSIDEHVNSSKIEHTYDPLLDAQNRAKKAIKEAKDVSNLYQSNIKPMETEFLEKNQLSSLKLETDSFSFYKVEIIDTPKDFERYSSLIHVSKATSSGEEEIKINQLNEQITELLHENRLALTNKKSKNIEFIIDPVNRIILINLSSESLKMDHNLKSLLENMSFDAILMDSNLNEKAYFFRVEI
ncbi:hypothetical protein F900_02016 [Acinetobacter modestus]|uniref:Uncharacterized protein n=1 Tax=Acinetobacter modestus TaxID=1776740 RepID=N9N418_9GAMM|nr:hypothetical protein [Acinetobacter modestus]ENX00346.1 hypothetical protein F900_02016 [Acinetobacter modestus]